MLLRVLVLLLVAGNALAADPPWLLTVDAPAAATDTLQLPALDVTRAKAEDYSGKPVGDPPRIGLVARVDGVGADPTAKRGRWSRLPDGRERWLLGVSGPNAVALDFSFARFRLPAGAELWIRTPDGRDWIGPFTDADNTLHGRFYTPLLPGAEAVLELIVPAGRRDFVELELEGVSRHYRDLFSASLQKSGSCNIDTICPQGDPYREQIRSVARYTFQKDGSTFVCTGSLVATTQSGNDAVQPTFVTANHCVSTASSAQSMVFYWRYESPTCRTPGSSASGSPLPVGSNSAASQSGASLLATHQPTDFTVVRLSSAVPAAAQAFWSGWDRGESGPPGSVSIHHPAGDEKRIALNSDPLTITASCIANTPSNTHWRVNNWEQGTTEQGSSGAGLWRSDSKRLIGVLSGGDAACSNPSGHDCFGRLATAWNGGGTASSRARDWLDPAGTGAVTHDASSAQTLQITLSSSAFSSLASAGDVIVIDAAASGVSGPYTYQWDVDGDGVFERSGTSARIEVSFARRTSAQVRVRVTASGGVTGEASRALDVRGPQVTAAAVGGPVQECGNNNGSIDPGERWRQSVRLSNSGSLVFGSGDALFAASAQSSTGLPFGPNAFGYVGNSSQSGGCSYGFVDIASGFNAVAPLATFASDGADDTIDDARSSTITLGGTGFSIYGERRTQAVMTTNGYLSFADAESALHWDNDCAVPFEDGSLGPQLRPLHDDLIIGTAAGAGLRYRYFSQCPRTPEVDNASPQGCHVFQWSGMERLSGGDAFEFQAIAYERSGQVVYQYRTADPLAGGSATIGLIDADGTDPLNVGCDAGGSAPAQSAICLYAPAAAPGSGSGPALRVLDAVKPVAGIAVGGNVTVDVPFQVGATTACGTPLSIDYIASVDNRAHWFARNPVLSATVAGSCQPVTSCGLPVTGPVPLPVRPGLYFDPARDANGVNTVLVPLDNFRTIFGGLWYTGERNHTPTWYELNGELFGLAGEVALLRYTKPPSASFPASGSSAGRAWAGFTDDRRLLIAWDISGHGSGAERMQRVDLPFATPNHTSAWFNPSEAGWGVALESLNLGSGNVLEYAAAYLYDGSGAPRWIAGSAPTVNGGTWTMLGYSPQCPGCPRYTDVQSRTSNAGTLRIDYLGPTSGRISTNLSLPAPWTGTWLRTNLPIQPIVTPTSGAASE